MPDIRTTITPPRVPLTDVRTGMISREWYRFFLNLFVITGEGSSDITLPALDARLTIAESDINDLESEDIAINIRIDNVESELNETNSEVLAWLSV